MYKAMCMEKHKSYHVKRGMMTWKQFRRIINITEFTESNIHKVCQEIRAENLVNDIKVDY